MRINVLSGYPTSAVFATLRDSPSKTEIFGILAATIALGA